MWSILHLLCFIGTLYSDRIAQVTSFYINMTEFREIDSDFDLASVEPIWIIFGRAYLGLTGIMAVANFKKEDFDLRNIKGIDYAGTKFNYFPKQLPNRTSEEDRKLIEDAFALINSSSEKEHQRMLKLVQKKMHTEFTTSVRPGSDKKLVQKRVKREGEGKYAEAAKVTNLKMLRIYLAMFSNLWSSSYYGGSHPMHKDVPKAVMILFKHRIMEFFFPPVGESKV